MTTRTRESIPTCWGTDAAVGMIFGFLHTYKTLALSESPGTRVLTVLPTLPAWASSCVKVFPPVVKGSFNSSVMCFMERGVALGHIPGSNVQRPNRNLLLFRGRKWGILCLESEKALGTTKSYVDFYTSCARTHFCHFRHLFCLFFPLTIEPRMDSPKSNQHEAESRQLQLSV